jgi:hypothetical protein
LILKTTLPGCEKKYEFRENSFKLFLKNTPIPLYVASQGICPTLILKNLSKSPVVTKVMVQCEFPNPASTYTEKR